MSGVWTVGLWPQPAPLSAEKRLAIDRIKPELHCDRAALTQLLELAVGEHRLNRSIQRDADLIVSDDSGKQIGRLRLQHRPRQNRSPEATFRPVIAAWRQGGFTPTDIAHAIELAGGACFQTARGWCYATEKANEQTKTATK